MASKYCYIAAACSKYLPELTALLNSLEIIGNKYDVHVIGIHLPESFQSQYSKLSYKVIHHEIAEEEIQASRGISEVTCRKRYWYAAEIGKDYEAICVLDADMFFVRDVTQFFEIATKTKYIVGSSLEQKRLYGHIEHHKINDVQILDKPIWNEKDICCSPMFFDAREENYQWLFRECWEIFNSKGFKAPDMESYSLLLLSKGWQDKILALPGFQFVSSNEKAFKPYIRFVKKVEDPTPGGKIWSEIGDPIYIIHGGYYNLKWRNQQILNRLGCIAGYIGGSEKCENMARGVMDMVYAYFKECLNGVIRIDTTIEYRNDAMPGERTITV